MNPQAPNEAAATGGDGGPFRRVYRPQTPSVGHYLLDLSSVVAGVLLMVNSAGSILPNVIGGGLCLLGLWQLFSTRWAQNSWFLITDEQISKLTPNWQLGCRWDSIHDVLIRQHTSGLAGGRASRIVIVRSEAVGRLPFYTSVLSVSDEQDFLAELKRRAPCPVRTMDDD